MVCKGIEVSVNVYDSVVLLVCICKLYMNLENGKKLMWFYFFLDYVNY